MKTIRLLTLTLFSSLLIIVSSCKKNKEGGKATISGQITYSDATLSINGAVAPYAKVQIAYNATGPVSSYNHEITADANGNYKFNVYKGDYYIHVIYDTGNSQKPYEAGGHVKVGRKDNATLNLNAQ